MPYPANTLGGQITVSSTIQQVGPALSFGGTPDRRPADNFSLRTALSSTNASLSEDSYDVLCAWRGSASDSGVPVYFYSTTAANQILDVHGNKVRLARVVALIVRNLHATEALDVAATWAAGPIRGTSPSFRIRPKSAKSDSALIVIAPDAAGYAVAGVSEQDFISVKNVTSGANNLYDILIAGIAA